jgi:hypothetical protein
MLSILTTRRCTAQCDHCCVGASPRATPAIPVTRIHGLIDEAKRIASIERIVFTGGECFLLGRDLDALVAHAHELELITRTITNGYWAVNERAASERVRALRSAGLDEMMLSTGTFHQRFVPVERIVHAARAAAAAGIATRIAIEDCDQQTFDDAPLRDELRDDIAAKRVALGRDPWTTDAGGRGTAELTHRQLLEHGPDRAAGRCSQILTGIAVTPDQQLTACCGFPLEELPRLRIGSIADRALDELLDQTPNRLLVMALHAVGPSGIAELVARHLPGFRLAPAASICQACVALQRDDDAMRVVADHASELVRTAVPEFLRLHDLRSPREPSSLSPLRSAT